MATGLHAGAASALSFNFSFTGSGSPVSPATVTGTVSGLVDNLNDQITGLTVTIASATNTPAGGWPTFTQVTFGNGFDVAAGQITGADICLTKDTFYRICFGNQNTTVKPELVYENPPNDIRNDDANRAPSNTLRFTPVEPASVPGPLPLFGAAAAFGWSRRLRRRFHSPL